MIVNFIKTQQLDCQEMEKDNMLDLSSIIIDDENQNNIKLGDIIYLKVFLNNDNKGLISGEGFGTNKMECLLFDKESSSCLAYKQAELNIFRCLFRIIDGSYQNGKLQNKRKQENTAIDKTSPDQINVVYGQEIYLLHLYSECCLYLDSLVLAKENCCRELRLDSKISQNSCFMFQSSTKNNGEPLLYGDALEIKSSNPHLTQWGLGVQRIEPFSEIHATQIPHSLTIYSYNENIVNDNIINNGDIIILRNRYFGGYLSVTRKISSTKYLSQRLIVRNDQPIIQNYLELDNFRNQKNLEDIFKISLENEISPNSMWLVLRINNEPQYKKKSQRKDESKPNKTYIVQNVITGAFLLIENEKLYLTLNKLTDQCEFQIKSFQKLDQLLYVGELYRFIYNNVAVIQCENNTEINVQERNNKTNIDQQLFQIQRGPYLEAISATQIQAFYFQILEFYSFLQNWGLDDSLTYSYQKAFKQQKLLQNEIQQFQKLLGKMQNYLNQNELNIKKEHQFSMCSNDILDLLILLLQLIDQIIYQEQESVLLSTLVDKSAQRIAKQKFFPQENLSEKNQFSLMEDICNLIYEIVLDNTKSCDYLIHKEQLIEYIFSKFNQQKIIVQKILKQVVSRAQPSQHHLIKWVNKLQQINEKNIEEQILVIKIISLFMTSQFHFSVECQNFCRKKILQAQPFQLIKCSLINETLPIAVLEDIDSQFQDGNKDFCQSHQKNYPGSQPTIVYFEFFPKYDKEKKYYLYEQYFLCVLNLYANICKNRNTKNVNFIKEQIGLSKAFLEKLKTTEQSLWCKKTLIDLFINLFLDIKPLAKISTFENTCFLKQDLLDFDIQAPSGYLFYENVGSKAIQNSKLFKTLNSLETVADMSSLKEFSKHVINQQQFHLSFLQLFTQENYPQLFIKDSSSYESYRDIAKKQLTFFLSLLTFINKTIDLGYNSLATNQQILSNLPHIFIALIIQSNSQTQLFVFQDDQKYLNNLENLRQQFNYQLENTKEKFKFIQTKSWISEFLIWSVSACNDQDLIESVFLESLNIYRTYFYLESNLKIINYLAQKNFQYQNIFADHSTLLFHCLFGQSRIPRLSQEILNYLIMNFGKELHDLKEIKEIEILDDEIEVKYYCILNGHDSFEDILGPKEIKMYIKASLKYIKMHNSKLQSNKKYQASFQAMKQYLVAINKLFEELQALDQTYFYSFQNMIRNAGIHLVLNNFLIQPEKVVEKEEIVQFYNNLILFWLNFLKDNQTNFQIMVPYLDSLLKIILIPQPGIQSFTYHPLSISKIQLWNFSGAIDLIQNICNSLDLRSNLIHIRAGKQYLKILRSLTKTNTKPNFNILGNQKQIILLLLFDFKDLIDPTNYFGEIEDIQNQKNEQLDILRYQTLKLHSQALHLVADSCQNYFLGISEMQRILVFECLINILQNCPYVVKAAYLRCIFELHVNLIKQHNQSNEVISFFQIKELFTFIIIPDFELMQSVQKRTSYSSSIKASNNDYWKYVIQTIQFLVSVIDEFRMLNRKKQSDIMDEVKKVQFFLQQLLQNNQRKIIRNKREFILQVIKIIDEYIENQLDFNLNSRLLMFCLRMDIQLIDLITYVESLKNRDNFEKLIEICNQNNKIYLSKDEFKYKFKRSLSKLDTITINDNWLDFKLKLNLLREEPSTIGRRMKEELRFQNLREQFQTYKTQYFMDIVKKENLSIQTENVLSEDMQIFLFLHQILNQKENFLSLENIKEFLEQCKQIFKQQPHYLIKLLQIFLTIKRPFQDQIQQNGKKNSEQEQRQFYEYVQFQNLFSEKEIDLLALELLNDNNIQIQLQGLSVIQQLLEYGNQQVQQRLYQVLKGKRKRKFFVQFFQEFYRIDALDQLEFLRLQKTTIYEQFTIKVLQVLQGLCENVHLDFQKFLLIQNEQDSITNNFNFILETTNLLLNFFVDQSVDDIKKWNIYQQGLLCLIEFSTGIQENKRQIILNYKLFQALSRFFRLKMEDDIFTKKIDGEQTNNFSLLNTFSIYIKLLISLLEGNIKQNIEIYKFLIENIDVNFLLEQAKKVYHQRIKPKLNNLLVDNCCLNPCIQNICNSSFCKFGFKTQEDQLLIEASLNIFIIGLKLSIATTDKNYDIFKLEEGNYEQSFEEQEEEQKNIENEADQDKVFSLSHRQPSSDLRQYTQLNSEENQQNSFDEIEEKSQNLEKILITRKDEFFVFYREFVGRIEVVNQQGKIERVFFQKPFACKYVTPNIKQHLIYKSNRETDEDRIASLLENVNFYYSQMKHYQNISTFPIMHFGQKHWRKLKDLSYIFCILIVVFFIIWPEETANFDPTFNNQTQNNSDEQINSVGKVEQVDTNQTSAIYIINNITTIIQLILNLIIIIFCAVERYPIAMHFNKTVTNSKLIQKIKQEGGGKIPYFLMKYHAFIGYLERNFDQKNATSNPLRKIIILLILDFDNFYNVIIFGTTIIAFFNTYVYAILLLDIVKRSEVLQYIIKAVTENAKNLLLFGMLGVIGLVEFGCIMRLSFSDQFKDEQKFASDSLGYSIAHVVNLGLRSGGGVGDSLNDYPNPFEEPDKYWQRYFFDLCFFIIFNMIFIQMIFGIIVDKFGELRDQRSDLLKDIEGKCFICSLDRNVIDSKTKNGWYFHIYLEHNVYHMLYFLIYIKMKPITECNKLEKYIKDQIETKQSDFFPMQSTLELEEEEQVGESE